jgi:hypothetical protein
MPVKKKMAFAGCFYAAQRLAVSLWSNQLDQTYQTYRAGVRQAMIPCVVTAGQLLGHSESLFFTTKGRCIQHILFTIGALDRLNCFRQLGKQLTRKTSRLQHALLHKPHIWVKGIRIQLYVTGSQCFLPQGPRWWFLH